MSDDIGYVIGLMITAGVIVILGITFQLDFLIWLGGIMIVAIPVAKLVIPNL